VVVWGGGELASAAARLLFLSGFPVVVLERKQPLAVRRKVSFAEAVFAGETTVESVVSRLCQDVVAAASAVGWVPVLVDPEGRWLSELAPAALVDARLAKRNLGVHRGLAQVVVGVGPGFTAGRDVHAAVETQRGTDLGRVLWQGSPIEDTGLPAPVDGVAEARVLRAPCAGAFRAACRIGDWVEAGASVGAVAGTPVPARIAGRLRGLLAEGVVVEDGVKLGDLDPRGDADPSRLSDKGRAVAAGVLEAVLVGLGPPA
jgi:xanthine dehydrogenase accessory factor